MDQSSFVSDERNQLEHVYRQLRALACVAPCDSLMDSNGWNKDQVCRYLATVEVYAQDHVLLPYFLGSQAPGSIDLLRSQLMNSSSTRQGRICL